MPRAAAATTVPTARAGRPARRGVRPLDMRLVGACVAAASLASACGAGSGAPRDGLEPDTARFSYGGRAAEVSLAACGREGDVVVLAGRSNGVVLQVEADLGDGGEARTGVTADLGGDGIVGAFGADTDLGPAGRLTDVRAEGDRLIVEGEWTTFDGDLRPIAPAQTIEGRMVARCPETRADRD